MKFSSRTYVNDGAGMGTIHAWESFGDGVAASYPSISLGLPLPTLSLA